MNFHSPSLSPSSVLLFLALGWQFWWTFSEDRVVVWRTAYFYSCVFHLHTFRLFNYKCQSFLSLHIHLTMLAILFYISFFLFSQLAFMWLERGMWNLGQIWLQDLASWQKFHSFGILVDMAGNSKDETRTRVLAGIWYISPPPPPMIETSLQRPCLWLSLNLL